MRLFLGLCVMLLAGCGDGITLYPVSGTVLVDDTPVEGLMVGFTPEGGGISGAGTTNAAGEYTITSTKGRGLPAGNYKVAIQEVAAAENASSEEEEAYQSSDSAAYERMAMGDPSQYKSAEAKAKREKKLPAKYNAQSTLQEIVAETENVIDFKIAGHALIVDVVDQVFRDVGHAFGYILGKVGKALVAACIAVRHHRLGMIDVTCIGNQLSA